MKINEIKPQNNCVLASIELLPSVNGDGIYLGEQRLADKLNTEYYYGKALKITEKSTDEKNCPELQEGDFIIFNQFAGSAINVEEEKFCKIIYGHDIVAIAKDLKDMNAETLKPTRNRILVEIIEESQMNDGIFDGSQADPRDKQTQKGRVVSCGESVEGDYKEGDIVFFDPYCGNLIVNEEKLKIKTVNDFDILFSI